MDSKDLYAKSILTCTFGIKPEEFYQRFVYRHILIIICVLTLAGNSFILFYLTATSGASPFLLASKMFIPIDYLFYIFEWSYIVYHIKFLSDIDFNLKYSNSVKFAAKDANNLLLNRNNIYTISMSWFKKTYFCVAFIFVCVPALQAIMDWLNDRPMKQLVVLPLTEIPEDPLYSLYLYVFQSISIICCIILRLGVYEWAASFTFLLSTQVKIMELALTSESNSNTIPLKLFIEEHVMLLKKVDKFLWCFQTISSSKILLCIANCSFFTFLMVMYNL